MAPNAIDGSWHLCYNKLWINSPCLFLFRSSLFVSIVFLEVPLRHGLHCLSPDSSLWPSRVFTKAPCALLLLASWVHASVVSQQAVGLSTALLWVSLLFILSLLPQLITVSHCSSSLVETGHSFSYFLLSLVLLFCVRLSKSLDCHRRRITERT